MTLIVGLLSGMTDRFHIVAVGIAHEPDEPESCTRREIGALDREVIKHPVSLADHRPDDPAAPLPPNKAASGGWTIWACASSANHTSVTGSAR
ncbi:MAG: hypothetical protein ACI9MX_001357 [Candidatus Aldehydirespiratoraceae bacterium]